VISINDILENTMIKEQKINLKKQKIFSIVLLVSCLMTSVTYTFGVQTAQAARIVLPPSNDASYQAKFVSQSVQDPITLQTGETKEVIVKLKNIGTTSWSKDGRNIVSVYTINPKYRESIFAHSSWRSKSNPSVLANVTKPGEVGEFKLVLQAPAKAGTYTEDFYLAAENKTWIKGGYFYLKFNVVQKTTPQTSNPPNTGVQIAANGPVTITPPDSSFISISNLTNALRNPALGGDYFALPTSVSAQNVVVPGNQEVTFQVRYLNSGKKDWNGYVWRVVDAQNTQSNAPISVGLSSWVSDKEVVKQSSVVSPGEEAVVNFTFKAPTEQGDYRARFEFVSGNQAVPGGRLEVPFTVSQTASVNTPVPNETTTNPSRALISEPLIRVGLYKAEEAVQFKSSYPYTIYSGRDEIKGTLSPDKLATLSYANGQYSFRSEELSFTSSNFIRLVPDDLTNYFTLVNYDRTVSYRGNKNFNVYRGTLEYKYSPKSAAPYVIEEVPLDAYVAGIAETSDNSAVGYVKAVLVAARTYAYINIDQTTPPAQRTFDVYPTTVDQLYLGYTSEVLMPNVARYARETAGEMVTYQGAVVTTPYFGNSDGMTRSSKSVWGGVDKPWLQPVEAIYDKGKKLWGHGVGMSTYDALMRATKDNWTYDQLLKYYYTGVNVEKIY
jgi:peptidoglycan hydrolase-like amidase